MDKIYIVMSGYYSDYHISAVFSDREKARKYCMFHNLDQENGVESGDHRIEVYDLDEETPDMPAGFFPYLVRMDADGNVQECRRTSFSSLSEGASVMFWLNEETMQTDMIARDEIHAIKIANERRIAVIAMDKWGSRERVVLA